MATEIITTTQATNGDQPSLRQIRCSPIWNEPSETEARRWLGPEVREALPAALAETRAALEPATKEMLVRGLTSALTLVAPAGFSEGDRKAWLTAAAMTLKGVPDDLLRRGIETARRVSDHPSKIMPAIMQEIGDAWKRRRGDHAEVQRLLTISAPGSQESGEPEVVPCSPEDAAKIMAEYGLRTNPLDQCKRHLGPARKPTREDYIAMGVDPGALEPLTRAA